MSSLTIKKKSSHFDVKVNLRKQALVLAKAKVPKILDCYHANGQIYRKIAEVMDVDVLGIEIRESSSPFPCLRGDNKKIINTLNIENYDVIDLDAYTDPTDLMIKLIPRAKPGTIFVYTFCINRMAGTPKNLTTGNENIYHKVRTIENKYINEKWSNFLKTQGIGRFTEVTLSEKCFLKKYGYFIK